MKIEVTIAQAQFLKRLVAESNEWNNGASVADVLLTIESALKEEAAALTSDTAPRPFDKTLFLQMANDWTRVDRDRLKTEPSIPSTIGECYNSLRRAGYGDDLIAEFIKEKDRQEEDIYGDLLGKASGKGE